MKQLILSVFCILILHHPFRINAQGSNDYLHEQGFARIVPDLSDEALSLSWSVDKEVNIRWYILERSVNGEEFTMLALIPAKNQYPLQSVYEVHDDEIVLQPGMEICYHLKTVDMNGASHVSSLTIRKETDGLISSR